MIRSTTSGGAQCLAEAMERILGAPPGSSLLVDDAVLHDGSTDTGRTTGNDARMTAIIQTEKLTKTTATHRGIIDVDLEVDEGEAFGFLGPNGAGKTTTIRTLLDHLRPTSGRALVFGIETTVDPVAIHRRIGYLPGEFALYDKLTGGQTIEYFANLRGGVDAAYQADLIERLDIDPSRKFKEYSKGNKQKIGLVVALQHRPDLLILDEPTSGLDPLVQQTFFEVIREAKAEGRTVFLSSHILGEVEKTCDRVAIIRDGRLAKVDRVEALRDLAHHQVELRFAGDVPVGGVRRAARRQRRHDRRPHPSPARVGLDHAGRPRGRPLRAARLRQPRAVARGDVPRRVRPDGRARRPDMTTEPSAAPPPRPLAVPLRRRIYGFGSVFGKTLRDSRRATIIVAVLLVLLLISVSRRRRPSSTRPRRARSSPTSSPACRRSSRASPASRSTSRRWAATSSTSTARSSRSS